MKVEDYCNFAIQIQFILSKTIQFKNTTISFTDEGKATAVVFLHGFLENKKMLNVFIP